MVSFFSSLGQGYGGAEGAVSGDHIGGGKLDAGAVQPGGAGQEDGLVGHFGGDELDSGHDGRFDGVGGWRHARPDAVDATASGFADSGLGRLEGEALGHHAAAGLLDGSQLDPVDQVGGLGAGGLVAGEHDYGHVKVAAHGRIQTDLAG